MTEVLPLSPMLLLVLAVIMPVLVHKLSTLWKNLTTLILVEPKSQLLEYFKASFFKKTQQYTFSSGSIQTEKQLCKHQTIPLMSETSLVF